LFCEGRDVEILFWRFRWESRFERVHFMRYDIPLLLYCDILYIIFNTIYRSAVYLFDRWIRAPILSNSF
jgi:hypothetical protein